MGLGASRLRGDWEVRGAWCREALHRRFQPVPTSPSSHPHWPWALTISRFPGSPRVLPTTPKIGYSATDAVGDPFGTLKSRRRWIYAATRMYKPLRCVAPPTCPSALLIGQAPSLSDSHGRTLAPLKQPRLANWKLTQLEMFE